MFKKLALAAVVAVTVLTGCQASEPGSKYTQVQLKTDGFEMVKSHVTGFESGSVVSAKTAFIFFDPQCPHCSHMWESAKPLKNQVHFVWVPVGVLSPVSTPQGAVLIASTEPVLSMQAHEDSLMARTGGIAPGSAKAADIAKVKANTALFTDFGLAGVPTMVFKDSVGATKMISAGMTTEEMAKALGVKP